MRVEVVAERSRMADGADPPAASRVPRQRSSAIDAVRVLATATVVAAHAFSAHPWTHYVLVSWHVPVFCLLSGYLFSRRRGFGDELRRRARTLLVPYVSWMVLVTAIWSGVQQHRGHPLNLAYYENLLRGGAAIVLPYSPYWFVTALFFVTLIARVLERTWLVSLAGLAGLVAIELWPEGLRSVWLAAGLALPCLAFFAAGLVLRNVRRRIARPLLVGLSLIASGMTALCSGITPLDVKQGDLGTPGLAALAGVALAAGIVLVAECVFTGRRHHIQALSVLATSAMPVVLGHTLVLGLSAEVPSDSSVWVFLVAVVVPWLGGLVATRIPVLRALFL
jgi:acyltransferase